MLHRLMPIILLVGLASCGASQPAADDRRDIQELSLASDAFRNGQQIPVQFTCDGANNAPALRWSDPPAGTRGFALVIDDPDAPGGTSHHWGVFNIPGSARSIGGGESTGTAAANDFGQRSYGGPCPPRGHGPHHYHFKLFALDVDRLGLNSAAKVADVEDRAGKHAIAKGELIGTYERH